MNPWLIVVIVTVLVAFAAVTIIWGMRAHRLKVEAGAEEMVGRKAEVRTALNPKGTVFLEGELWAAVSETGNIEPGTQVVITRVEGLILYVAKKV
jgi:membrane-bound serine protease (ClpP class)